jgi:hypothetical protein
MKKRVYAAALLKKNDEIVALMYSRSTKPSTQFEVTV